MLTADCPTGRLDEETVATPLLSVVAGAVCPAKLKLTLRPVRGLPVPSVNRAARRRVLPKKILFCPTYTSRESDALGAAGATQTSAEVQAVAACSETMVPPLALAATAWI